MAGGLPALVADLDYPMAVVTCDDGSRRSGCLVGFLSQCSIHPPRMTVWISEANHTHPVALASDHLAVHLLSSAGPDRRALAGPARLPGRARPRSRSRGVTGP